MDTTIYKLLLWALPLLLAILAFIGGLAVKSLIKLANDVNEIKTTLATYSVKHDDLERRVGVLETINMN